MLCREWLILPVNGWLFCGLLLRLYAVCSVGNVVSVWGNNRYLFCELCATRSVHCVGTLRSSHMIRAVGGTHSTESLRLTAMRWRKTRGPRLLGSRTNCDRRAACLEKQSDCDVKMLACVMHVQTRISYSCKATCLIVDLHRLFVCSWLLLV
jgi:hypothetical protein